MDSRYFRSGFDGRAHHGHGGFGPGAFGPDARHEFMRAWGGPRARKGDVRMAILALLSEEPASGYGLIKAIAERTGHTWRPSPGSVYPTLQMLEDLGHVTSYQQDGKRVYQITDEGRAFLVGRKETIDDIRERTRTRFAPWIDEEDVRDFADEMREFGRDMRDFGKMFAKSQNRVWRDPATRERIREVLRRTRQEIDDILRDSGSAEKPAGEGPAAES